MAARRGEPRRGPAQHTHKRRTFLGPPRCVVGMVRVVRRDPLLLRTRAHTENRHGVGPRRDLGLPALAEQVEADVSVRVDVRVARRRLEEVNRRRLRRVLARELDAELVLLALEECALPAVERVGAFCLILINC